MESTMDLSREPEADDSGLSHLKMTPQDAHKILERFTEDQLLEIVQFVISRDPIALNDVRSIADTDLARRKLYIRGLGSEITTKRLRSIFAVFGEVAEAFVIYDRNTGKSKKYGFVTFKHIDGAVLALREPKKKIDGRIIVAQLAAAGNTWFRRVVKTPPWVRTVVKPPPGFGNQGQISFGRGYGGGLNNSGSSSINSLP